MSDPLLVEIENDPEIRSITVQEQVLVEVTPEPEVIQITINEGYPGPQGPAGADGASGGTTVDSGTWNSPNVITTSIPLDSDEESERIFLSAATDIVEPTVGAPGGSRKTIKLVYSGASGSIEFNENSTMKPYGKLVMTQGSVAQFSWVDGLDKYLEDFRNEA